MAPRFVTAIAVFGILLPLVDAAASQAYTWKNVKIGGGGGFVPGIVFNPTQKVVNHISHASPQTEVFKGLAFARTDIGGAYKLNADDSWTPLLDFADDARWNYWGVDAIATDPVEPNRLYLVSQNTSCFSRPFSNTGCRPRGCTPTLGTPTTGRS